MTSRIGKCLTQRKIRMKGFDVNYLHGFSLTQKIPLYLEVGGRLTFDTYKWDKYREYYGSWFKEKDRFNILSLSVPINVSYKYTFNNGLYIAPFAGIHFRLNLLGQWKYETVNSDGHSHDGTINLFKADDYDDDAFCEEDEDPCKRFQFGGQLGVNFGYKAWNMGLAYYLDTPFYKYDEVSNSKEDFKYKASGIALTVGYNF